jgi:hypothetical protein
VYKLARDFSASTFPLSPGPHRTIVVQRKIAVAGVYASVN